MDNLWRSLGGMVAVIGFAIVLNVPKRFLFLAGLDGGLGWFVYLVVEQWTGSMLAGTFAGAAVGSVIAHLFARIFKTPVTMFVIPANLTLVPGAGMYRIVYYTLQSDDEMMMYYFQQTLLAAGVIAAAIFIVNILIENFVTGYQNIKKLIQNCTFLHIFAH